jgi:hypothetical protein
MTQAVLERDLGAERPADRPRVGQAALRHEVHSGGEIEPLVDAVAEPALRRAARRGHAAEVEPQHGDVGESGESRRRLPDDVGVHESAVRGQRMQRDDRRDGVGVERQRELPHEGQAVRRHQLDVFASRGKLDAAADLDRGAHGAPRA